MSTKTYQSVLCHYSGLFNVGGVSKRIQFEGSTNNSKGIYTTSIKAEQDAIEGCPKFANKEIYLFREYSTDVKTLATPTIEDVSIPIKKDAEEVPATEAKKDYSDIKTVQNAARALIADFGVTTTSVSNKEKVLAKAGELGVTFPGLA